MITLAIDPGKRNPGAALFRGNVLLAAKCVPAKPPAGASAFECAVLAAYAVATWASEHSEVVDSIVCEWPQVYEHERKKDPNNLLPLAGVNTAVAALFTARALARGVRSPRLVMYKPRDWKGSVNGDAFLERIAARLSDAELARIERRGKTYDHNAIDAIGLGLKYLGRLERKRVIPR